MGAVVSDYSQPGPEPAHANGHSGTNPAPHSHQGPQRHIAKSKCFGSSEAASLSAYADARAGILSRFSLRAGPQCPTVCHRPVTIVWFLLDRQFKRVYFESAFRCLTEIAKDRRSEA